ncbi:MAG TPA: SH3 domain-containing protein [Thermomicrobiales bacterium]
MALLVATIAMTLSPATARADGSAYVDTDVLNLRDGPGTWANVIDQMWQGESIDVLDGPTDDGWYEVSYYGEVGWAYGGYLSIDGESGWSGGADTAGGVGGFGATAWVDTDRLNMRAWASLDADVLDLLVQGEEVTVTGTEQNGFVPVNAHGVSAWVWGGYLSYDGSVDAGPEHWIDVDRSSHVVTLYEGDQAVDSFWASLGYDPSTDGFYSTAVGTYYVYSMYAPLSWTDFGKTYIEWWVGFDPDRQNGFHSYSMDRYGNVLPNGDGPTGGCVATEPSAAAEIYNFASIGMRVEVHQ